MMQHHLQDTAVDTKLEETLTDHSDNNNTWIARFLPIKDDVFQCNAADGINMS